MKKRITLNDIAKALNVNPSTVSRALNPSTSSLIGTEQRTKIEKTAQRLNYQPKLSARSLATSKSYSIGLALHDLELDFASPFFALLLSSLSRHLHRKNYSLSILPVINKKSRDEEILKYLKIGRVDGFLINSGLAGKKTLEFLLNEKTPIVFFDHYGELENKFCIVRTDENSGAEELVEELWRLGHRKAAYFLPDYVGLPMRYIAYKEAWSRKNGFFRDSDTIGYTPEINGSFADRDEARKAAEKNMDMLLSYSAIICCSDLIAFGVVDALTAKGIKIGMDISVVGYDNIEDNPNYKTKEPFLTSIEKEYVQMGKIISNMLMDRIENPLLEPVTKEVQSRLIIRNSLGKAK